MDYQLARRPALVTGASRGIGRAIAELLAREGAEVALLARDAALLAQVATAIADDGGRAHALPADLAAADGATLLERASEALGAPPSVLVVDHASFTPMAKIHSLDPEAIEAALAADLSATMGLLRAAVPEMMARRFGRIVLVSSVAAALGQGKAPLYCAIKGALEGLMRNLAIDFGRFGVTANVVAPGFVDTERLRRRADDARREQLRQATSAKRLGTPQQIAEVVVFLCSAAASYLTGAVIPVSGGAHLANLW